MSGSATWVMHGGIRGGRWDSPNIPLHIPSAPLPWLMLMCKGKLRHGAHGAHTLALPGWKSSLWHGQDQNVPAHRSALEEGCSQR